MWIGGAGLDSDLDAGIGSLELLGDLLDLVRLSLVPLGPDRDALGIGRECRVAAAAKRGEQDGDSDRGVDSADARSLARAPRYGIGSCF